MTHLSLFTGIGGLDLAAEAAGFQTVGQCEWADYPTKILERHWPNVPRWRDIRALTGKDFYERTGLRTVDLISGGFPCQPFSTAGKRRGKEDDRYLWPEMLLVIKELRPRWVVGENVAGIINMALDTVLSDLERQGYETRTFVFPACAVDAPHRRDRCAIVAYSNRVSCGSRRTKPKGFQWKTGASDGGDVVANSDSERRGKFQSPVVPDQKKVVGRADREDAISDSDHRSWTLRRNGELQATESPGGIRGDLLRGTPEHGVRERRTVEPGMGRSLDGLSAWMDGVRAGWADGTWEAGIPRIATGVPDRVQRLKCLGNAVVPTQFYPIFQAIADIERKSENEQGQAEPPLPVQENR